MPPAPSTANPLPVFCTTATSSVPAPKSKTAIDARTGTGRRSTSAKYRAAATGSGTSRGGGHPALAAAPARTARRVGPHAAG